MCRAAGRDRERKQAMRKSDLGVASLAFLAAGAIALAAAGAETATAKATALRER